MCKDIIISGRHVSGLTSVAAAAHRLGVPPSALARCLAAVRGSASVPVIADSSLITAQELERAACRLRRVSSTAIPLDAVADALGISTRAARGLVASGHLREVLPGLGLFALVDVERAALAHAEISDPISLVAAAEILRLHASTFQHHVDAGRLRAVHVGTRWFFSRAEIAAIARRRDRLLAGLQRLLAEGALLTETDAAKALGISEVSLYNAVDRGVLKPISIRFLMRRSYFRRRDVERVLAERLVKGPRRAALPKGLLMIGEAAALLGLTVPQAKKLLYRGRLVSVARGGDSANSPHGFRREDVLRLKAEWERQASLITSGEACRRLGISWDSLNILVKRGLLPNEGDAHLRRFDAAKLAALHDHADVAHFRRQRRRGQR